MKSTVSFFLLTIFLFNTIGYFVVFKISQNQIRKEVKREIKMRLNDSDLHAIVFNKNELSTINWVKTDKEFSHDKELYDIVRTSETETTITYYCINDKQEEQLFGNLEDHINKHIASNKSNKKNNIKSFDDKNKIAHDYNFKLLSNTGEPIERIWSFYKNYESISLAKNTPPPRF